MLLSPGFVQRHCVSLAASVRRNGAETLVGLAFEPRTDNRLSEIKGTIWVDSATSELRRVEYEYVRAALPVETRNVGGFVEFQRAKSGGWIVSNWVIRLPRWRSTNLEPGGVRLDGYTETGGSARGRVVPALEDKLVQRAVVEVLNAIYDTDFLGFSYGFRPGRSPHDALDALSTGLLTQKVNWVLDADIQSFFDTLQHGWLVKFIEHRVADRRVVRLIQKWLNAGVLEDGERTCSEVGTVQGGSISPLLANIYLHYVFDLWVQRWRQTQATGDVIVVRFADDCAPRRRREEARM